MNSKKLLLLAFLSSTSVTHAFADELDKIKTAILNYEYLSCEFSYGSYCRAFSPELITLEKSKGRFAKVIVITPEYYRNPNYEDLASASIGYLEYDRGGWRVLSLGPPDDPAELDIPKDIW